MRRNFPCMFILFLTALIFEANADAAPQPVPKITTGPVLPDGSFNPIAPIKARLTDDPATLIRMNNWRARYQAALGGARPAADRPGFYVYTFLDRTREGIGVQFTYGWRLVGSAALECWTDARMAGGDPPRHYGLPVVDENSTPTQPALDEWLAQALDDPATAGARYIISGAYEFSPQTKITMLTIKMIDRRKPESASTLCTVSVADDKDFVRLAAGQREAARAMTEKLIAGDAIKRREPPTSGAEQIGLEKELGWVARMFDSNDSWAIMDGIDQALALQAILPGETLPLQAACYGMIELEWAFCDYSDQNMYGMDYIMRAFALAQVAVAMDPKPSMSQLNWIYGTAGFAIDRKRLAGAIPGMDTSRAGRELETYRNFVLGDFKAEHSAEQLAVIPDWHIIWLESEQARYSGTSPLRAYFNERVENWQAWPSHDLFFEAAVVDQKDWNHDEANKNRFGSLLKASTILTRQTVASELAAILSAQKSGTAVAEVSEITGVEAGLLRMDDYHALRTNLASSFKEWEPPFPPHPAYAVLKWMDQQADAMAADALFSEAATGFLGFEFTPLERVRFAQRHDHLGPLALTQYEANRLVAMNVAMDVASAYFSARPENAAAHAEQAGCMVRWVEKGDDVLDQWIAARQNALNLFPIEQNNYFGMGSSCFYVDRQQTGMSYIREYLRQNPYSATRNQRIGELFRRYGYHALAVEFLGEALKERPKRYDLANERAWSLVEMGHAKDPEVRRTFGAHVHELRGNSSFHAANLRYLFYWDQDMNAAREAALFYMQCKPESMAPIDWLIRIELKDGNTSAALHWLKLAPPAEVAKKRSRLADYYAQLAGYYLDLKMPREAEAMIAKAADEDEWDSDVIDMMGRYYCAMRQYDKAFAEYQRQYDRFGPSAELYLNMADCLYQKGMKDEAYRLLDDQVARVRRGSGMVDMIPKMMEYYAERGEKEKARDLMRFLLNSGTRTRTRISDTLNSYKKLDPEEAKRIWDRIDEIMAGPQTIG
ncbi:MAG: tetratricopeptide repeat protein [Candidatus Sumerlaeia bacterium]